MIFSLASSLLFAASVQAAQFNYTATKTAAPFAPLDLVAAGLTGGNITGMFTIPETGTDSNASPDRGTYLGAGAFSFMGVDVTGTNNNADILTSGTTTSTNLRNGTTTGSVSAALAANNYTIDTSLLGFDITPGESLASVIAALTSGTTGSLTLGFGNPDLVSTNNAIYSVTVGGRVVDPDPDPDPNVVPLPAGLPLVLTALGGLAVLRRKTR